MVGGAGLGRASPSVTRFYAFREVFRSPSEARSGFQPAGRHSRAHHLACWRSHSFPIGMKHRNSPFSGSTPPKPTGHSRVQPCQRRWRRRRRQPLGCSCSCWQRQLSALKLVRALCRGVPVMLAVKCLDCICSCSVSSCHNLLARVPLCLPTLLATLRHPHRILSHHHPCTATACCPAERTAYATEGKRAVALCPKGQVITALKGVFYGKLSVRCRARSSDRWAPGRRNSVPAEPGNRP